jgi:polyhydroxyalkanoate synthesis regulator phasin
VDIKRFFLACCATLPLLSLSSCDAISDTGFKQCWTKSGEEFKDLMNSNNINEYLELLKKDSEKQGNIKSIDTCFKDLYKKSLMLNLVVGQITSNTKVIEKIKNNEKVIELMEVLNKAMIWLQKLDILVSKLNSEDKLTANDLEEFKAATKKLELFLASKGWSEMQFSSIDTLISATTSATHILNNLNTYKNFSLELVKNGKLSPEEYIEIKETVDEVIKELNLSGISNALENIKKIDASLKNIYGKLNKLADSSSFNGKELEELRNAISELKPLVASEKALKEKKMSVELQDSTAVAK